MNEDKIPEHVRQYLIHLFDQPQYNDIHEFLVQADIYFGYPSGSSLGIIVIIADPELYKKNFHYLDQFKNTIMHFYQEFTHEYVGKVEIYPNLHKFNILKNPILPVITPWNEINEGQNHLIELLRDANKTIDYQNLGNTARTLLQRLSNIVFDPKVHISDVPNIHLGEGKFKNRLHTFIRWSLKGDENKELRDFILAVITTAEKSIDIANKLTHDLKAHEMLGEACVISAITTISFVKLVIKQK